MSLLPRFALNRHRAQEKVLEQQVTALQQALAQCKGMAKRWTEVRIEVMGIIAAVFLAIGFTLGVYHAPLQQSLSTMLASVGIGSSRPDFDTVNAVFQKGDYPAALRLAQPLADEGDGRAQSIVGQSTTAAAACRRATPRRRSGSAAPPTMATRWRSSISG